MTVTLQNKTDLELVVMWQDSENTHHRTRTAIEALLYKKYTPLCKNMSFKYQSVSTFEDNMQDCYLFMLEALAKVEVKKIHNPIIYSFGVSFKYQIVSLLNASVSNKKKAHNKNTEDILPDAEGNTIIFDQIRVEDNTEEIIFADTYKGFLGSLSTYEQKIMKLLKLGMKRMDIATEMKAKSTANIIYYTNRLQDKYVRYMNSNGYSIEV